MVQGFCGNTVSAEFWVICPTLCGNCTFPQNFPTTISVAFTVFYAVRENYKPSKMTQIHSPYETKYSRLDRDMGIWSA